MHIHRTPAILLALLSLTLTARAEPAVTVEVGWGNAYRAGRWNPIYITAKSDPPREVIAQVEGMHDAPHAMSVRSRFALSPAPSTHAVYFPLGESDDLRDTVLNLRDAATLKRIAGMKLALTPPVQQAPLGQPMIGVSGDFATFGLLKDQFAGDATVGFVTPPYLPVVAAGYDALDVLVLNAPDLSRIREDQQRAIVEWLRAGGTLVMWPGAGATPEVGPLIDVLPAAIGENQLIELDPAAVDRAGLTRVARIHSRQLTPVPDAEAFPLLDKSLTAYRRPVGFGQIVMAPIDLATLRFQSEDAVRAFWVPVLGGVPDRTRDNVPDAKVARWLRDTYASRTRTVPAWLIAALVVVGPVDSLLLKLLGRRPWTVVTVLGWGGLIAAVTYSVRERNRERPIEYRTVRLIDEVDGAAAIVTDFVAVRWPQGSTFEFPPERGVWWQPATDPTDPPESARSEFYAEQSEGGTWPARMPAHVPTPRVLQAQRWSASPSLIDGSLSVKDGRIVGKLTNRGEKALANVRIRVADGVARLDVASINAGASIDVSAPIDPADPSLDMPEPERSYEARRATGPPVLSPDYGAAESSTFHRSSRIADLLARGGRACVYAEVVDPAPPSDLPAATKQKHMGFVRCLMRLD